MSRTAVLGAAALIATSGVLVGTPAHASATASTTLVVDAAQISRPVTHVASGSLYGLASSTVPADSLVEAIRPNTFVQMAPGGHQLPNGEPAPAGDALVVAPEAARAGAKVVVRMPDWYPNFPYIWVSWSDWLSAVDKQIASVQASGATDIKAWEIWNEPNANWDTTHAGPFDTGWARTYAEIRSKDATTPIQGPSISDYSSSWMWTFLQDAIANHAVPDIISWHELAGSSNIAAHVADYRAIERSLGLSPRPISIEEYGAPGEVGSPGKMVGYVAKFERAGVSDAELAFWNHYGTLGDILTDTGASPNGAYWLYKWYGGMSGSMLTTTPPSQTGIDGAASRNSAGDQIDVIFGGSSGDSAVTVKGLNSLAALGSSVHVTLEYTPSPGRTVAVSGPTTLSEANYAVSNGSITVPVPSANSAYGYHLVITPASSGGSTLDGTYQIANKNSGLALDTRNEATGQGTLVDQATPNSSATQRWTLVSAGAGLYKIRNQASGLVLGISNMSTSDGGTALIWSDNGTSDHLWSLTSDGSGYYKIRNSNSGLLLGVQNMSTSSGAQVLQWDDNGTADHLWKLTAR